MSRQEFSLLNPDGSIKYAEALRTQIINRAQCISSVMSTVASKRVLSKEEQELDRILKELIKNRKLSQIETLAAAYSAAGAKQEALRTRAMALALALGNQGIGSKSFRSEDILVAIDKLKSDQEGPDKLESAQNALSAINNSMIIAHRDKKMSAEALTVRQQDEMLREVGLAQQIPMAEGRKKLMSILTRHTSIGETSVEQEQAPVEKSWYE